MQVLLQQNLKLISKLLLYKNTTWKVNVYKNPKKLIFLKKSETLNYF